MNLFLARRSRPIGLALASSVAGALLLVWVAACGDGPAGPAPQPPPAQPPPPPPPNRAPVATAAIPSDTLSAGDSLLVDLSAHFRDPDGDALTFAAATSDAAVATVSVSGDTAMVAAIAAGTATVTATATDPGALRAAQSFAVTVEAEVERVVVTPDSATLTAIGDTVRLTADAFDEAGRAVTGAAIAWSSGDAAVAVVDTAGLVTANGPGRTTIFASAAGPAGDVVGEAIVSVTPSAHSVTVSPSDAALAVGDTLRLRATVTDRNGHDVEGAEVTWTSNSPAVASVRPTGTPGIGLVSAISDGSATVTATVGEARGTARITVSSSPDRRVLAALYAATDGPNWKRRANWMTDAPLDEWQGLEVDAEGRVTQLILYENNLRGPIPAALAELTQLTKLDLSRNTLTGPIPPELGSLVHIEHLDISRNRQLTGSIPPELGLLTNLKYLRLGSNRLTGEIPPELGSLPRLVELRVNFNGLTGTIPPELGSLASLEDLSAAYNALSGRVPRELGDLTRLRHLGLQYNNFTGVIPREFTEWRRLVSIGFAGNDGLCAPGTPAFVTWLRSVQTVGGPFCNAADRAALALLHEATGGPDWTNADGWLGDAAVDEWWGVTADSLGRVVELDLADNNLSGRVHPALAALHRVTALRIGGNPLTGPLPLSLARLPLRELDYSDTEVCAPADASFREWLNNIPSHRGTGVACGGLSDRDILVSFYHATGGPGWTRSDNWLTDAPLGEWHGIGVDGDGRVTEMSLAYNNLTGSIPPEVGALERLRTLFLSGGNLTGPIPPQLGDLAELQLLHVIKNDLEGRIPPALGRLSRLEILGLSENRLEGGIPPELGALERMRGLYLNENDLTGPIPPELGNMTRLLRFHLWDNRLSGPIPSSLGDLAELEELRLGENDLTGSIPPELGRLGALERLMLFENDLSGPLPPELGNLRGLTHLSVFGNAGLAGPLPANLTRLRRLREFYAGGTDLCVPTDAEFRFWLRKIPASRVASCAGEAMAYLVQAAQSPAFPVPLVAGRDALLRVFVTAARSAEVEMPPVRATFYVDGGEVYAANIPGRGRAIPTEVDESSLSMSANARIPGHVLQPGLEMVIEVDPDGTLDPSLGVRRRIPETGRLAPEVRTLPVLDLTLIPFLWTQDPDSTTIDDVRAMAADPGRALWPVGTLLPVGELTVTAHEPVWSSTNYGPSLLEETEAIRVLEGGTGYYMGTLAEVPIGLRGIAQWRGRSSWSVTEPRTMAHELGHNLGLAHAPCGGAGGPDPAFPEPDGSIGVWGYDGRAGGRVVHASTRDIMSYCDPHWISDYHFTNALRYRLEAAAASAGSAAARPAPGPAPTPARALFVWGGVEAAGRPFLEPAFVVDVPPVVPAEGGDYRLEGADAEGRRLFSLSFDMPEMADGDGSSGFALALPAAPGWAGALARITLTGPGGSATLDGASDQPTVILRDPASGRVRGILRDLPASARAQASATAAVAATLPGIDGLNVLFSRGLPAPAAWRR